MSTPGNRDGDQQDIAGPDSARDTRRVRDTGENPTEMMDAGPSGAGSSSAGGAGSRSVDDHSAHRDGNSGSSNAGTGFPTEDDSAGEYVPGMYSDTAAGDTGAPTAPVPAPRAAAPRPDSDDTRVHTQAVPVTATRDHRTEPTRTDPRPADTGRDDDRQVSGAATDRTLLPSLEDRKLIHQREKEHFGGMKFGSAFFGWLTATGLFVILTALIGAGAALFGYGSNLTTADLSTGSGELQAAGITAAVVVGVILLVSYYAGGYVAGRMARFSGPKQGVAVWLWALIVAVVLTIIGLIAGNRLDVSEQFGNLGVPALGDLTGPGLIGLLIVAAIALVGAVLGGLAGMRYHRRIDRTDFDALEGR